MQVNNRPIQQNVPFALSLPQCHVDLMIEQTSLADARNIRQLQAYLLLLQKVKSRLV